MVEAQEEIGASELVLEDIQPEYYKQDHPNYLNNEKNFV